MQDVASVIDDLLHDRKIARATHPAIYAYRFTSKGATHGKVIYRLWLADAIGSWP